MCNQPGSFKGCLMHEPQLILLLNKTDAERESHFSCDSVLYGYSPRSTLSWSRALLPLYRSFNLSQLLNRCKSHTAVAEPNVGVCYREERC